MVRLPAKSISSVRFLRNVITSERCSRSILSGVLLGEKVACPVDAGLNGPGSECLQILLLNISSVMSCEVHESL